MQKIIVTYGGWDGHNPQQVAEIYKDLLSSSYDVVLSDNVDFLRPAPGQSAEDFVAQFSYDLIISHWTMSDVIDFEMGDTLVRLVASGVGMFGMHNGLLDAFRGNVRFQWLGGGQFMEHPHGEDNEFCVRITKHSALTEGLPLHFSMKTEQYYLLYDPAVTVHASAFMDPRHPGGFLRDGAPLEYRNGHPEIDMPVIISRQWGVGRTAACTLGHGLAEYQRPEIQQIIKNGVAWTCR